MCLKCLDPSRLAPHAFSIGTVVEVRDSGLQFEAYQRSVSQVSHRNLLLFDDRKLGIAVSV